MKKRFFAEGEQRIGGTDAGNYYYTRDHLNSVREVADATGSLQGQYDYDAWGNPVVVKGKMQVDFGYTGHYFHQPSGVNLAMYRAYSPTLGRWTSRDPLPNAEMRQGVNVYWYVANNPVSKRDPTGLATVPPGDGDGGCGTRGKYDNWYKKINDIFDKGEKLRDIADTDLDDVERNYRALGACQSDSGGYDECIFVCHALTAGFICVHYCENKYAQHCFPH